MFAPRELSLLVTYTYQLSKTSWLATIYVDLIWLQSQCWTLSQIGHPEFNTIERFEFIIFSKSRWFSIIRGACVYENDSFHNESGVRSCGMIEHQCPVCAFKTLDIHALAGHMSHEHQHKSIARWYAPGDTCLHCNKKFSTRPRLLRHLSYASPKCLTAIRLVHPPMADEEVEALDLADRAITKANKSKGLPLYFASVPASR